MLETVVREVSNVRLVKIQFVVFSYYGCKLICPEVNLIMPWSKPTLNV